MQKKIAFFIDSFDPGGAEVIVVLLSRKLIDHGFTIEIYHFGNKWLEAQCKKFKLCSKIAPGLKYYKSFITLPIFAIKFAKILKYNKIDLLHSHLYGAIIAGSISAKLAKIRNIGTLHDIYSLSDNTKLIFGIKIAAAIGTRLITVSKNMENYLQTLATFPAGSVKTIKNGVDLSLYEKPVDFNLKKKLGLDSCDFVFVSVGRLVKIKGYDVLIEAFTNIESRKSIKLLLVGDGPERSKLETEAFFGKRANDIIFIGHRDDVASILPLCDCFVLPSHSEGLSCSIIEAMASGKPVIATNVGGNSELVRHGQSGFILPANNSEILCKYLSKFINDENKTKIFSIESKRIAREEFGLDAMARNYMKEYSALML